MIVLRIRLDGVTLDHRLEHGNATLGSGSRATIRATNAGWPRLAATLHQEGTEVRMLVPGRVGTVTLRVGDEVRLGRADVSVVGLLPPEEESLPSAGEASLGVGPAGSAAPTALPASAPPSRSAPVAFGDYAESGVARFSLDEPPRARAPGGARDDLPRVRAPSGARDDAPGARTPAGLPPPPLPAAKGAADVSAPSQAAARPESLLPTAATTAAHPRTRSTSATPPPKTAAPQTPATKPVTSTWAEPQVDFSAELFAQIKRTPWFMASVAVHVLLFLLFWVGFSPTEHSPVRLGGGMFAGSLLPQETTAQERSQDTEASEAPEPLPTGETVPEPALPLDEAPAPSEEAQALPVVQQPEEELPSDLGTQPTLSAAGRRTTPRSVPSRSMAPSEDLREAFAKGTMHDARKRAAKHVLDALGVDKGGPGAALKKLAATEVLVVTGEWDHQERVLTELGIAHTKISPYDTAITNGSAFDQPRFVFWNCGEFLSPRYTAKLGPRVRAFVDRGGYLFTSDWALDNVVKPAFPGYVDTRGMSAPLPEMVLDIAPTRAGAGHPLLEGVFQPGLVGRWWLEQASHDIVIKKTGEVTILIESPQLRDLLSRSPTMAFTFQHGKGRVLHILGHYDQEEGNIAGTVAVQRIALNFLLLGMGATATK